MFTAYISFLTIIFHLMVITENNLWPKWRVLTHDPLSTSSAAGTPRAFSWRLSSVCFLGEVEVEGKLFQSWRHLEIGSACCHFLMVIGPPPGGQFSGEKRAVRLTTSTKHPGLGKLMGKGTWGPSAATVPPFLCRLMDVFPLGMKRKVH